MKPLIAILFACFLISVHSIAQRKFSEEPRKPDQFSMGVGFGQDFGGLGANMIVYPQKNIGLFVGGGYAIAGFGYNVGLKLRLTPPSSAVDP
ncbi:MAG TPA: hypothetical protein VFV08_09505, partial [Puia sp.]|nr:hypothetical protein [Puia sp.]